jgi:hypothetical protein
MGLLGVGWVAAVTASARAQNLSSWVPWGWL